MPSLSGTLLFDTNGDGVLDPIVDIPLQGWTVALYEIDGNGNADLVPEFVTTTDSSGNYQFNNIDVSSGPKQFIVRVIDTDDDFLNGYATPTLSGFAYVIPDAPIDPNSGSQIDPNDDPRGSTQIDIVESPLTDLDKVYTITITDDQVQIGGTDFEDADDLLANGGDADNIALDSEADQVWADIGFKFWWDDNQNFIGDALEGGRSMFLEGTNPVDPNGPNDTFNDGVGFVNDFLTGPFGELQSNGTYTPNPFPQQFDVETDEQTRQETQNGFLGDYFLRGSGLQRGDSTVPTFLIEYTLPTSSGSGVIVDIDTVYNVDGSYNPPQLQEAEQWKVEFFTDDDNDPTTAPVELEELEQLSPVGQAVWVPISDANNPIYDDSELTTTDPLGRSIDGWLYNRSSLDGRGWQWSFDTGEQGPIVDFVRISFVGEKDRNFVGFAFDQFQAFGQPTTTADFLFEFEDGTPPDTIPLASLGNFVFHDLNANGIQDAGEEGIAGATVTLTGDVNGDGVTDTLTTTTDAAGIYNFTNLNPGDYTVEFTTPDGFTESSPVNVGEDDTIDSDGTSVTTNLASIENDDTIDAGFYNLASLGDQVFIDADADGIQDAGEVGLDGVTVNLIQNGQVVGTQVTSNGGQYLFTDLVPGDYQVEFVAPDGFIFSPADQGGDDTADSDADPITGLTQSVTLISGENNLTLDAGLVELASLGDFVFEDLNADGIQDAGESGILGVTVNL
ncbi:SdrD B-like domain-containing protein, partial [Crocosphaera sp.]|uniref:SdrD B-like domain-containing protein n=1 Tax=Crocosphaera sp. TaxID=2729996 RepID=UPI0026093DE7